MDDLGNVTAAATAGRWDMHVGFPEGQIARNACTTGKGPRDGDAAVNAGFVQSWIGQDGIGQRDGKIGGIGAAEADISRNRDTSAGVRRSGQVDDRPPAAQTRVERDVIKRQAKRWRGEARAARGDR